MLSAEDITIIGIRKRHLMHELIGQMAHRLRAMILILKFGYVLRYLLLIQSEEIRFLIGVE